MQLMKTSLQPIEAILALMSRYLAYALYMKLLEVVCFCGHLQQKRSRIKFVLDSFQPVRLNELLNIFLRYTVFGYSSSKAQFSPCQTGLNMVNPE